ncbi:glycine/betaine/sarcosine/D-proline reductase family selenoprotein B [Lachnospiraceae bacterium PF1-4]
MENKKWRVVCYINQFFGQIGGEEMAHVGFSVKPEAVGPGLLFQKLLQDECEVVGTIICGDNYFAENTEGAVAEGVALAAELKPDLLIAGPAFNAGRYGISCGNMAAAVGKELNIPTVTGMYPENPAVDLFRKDTYIVETGILSSQLRKVAPVMADIGLRLLRQEPIGSAAKEGYIKRDIILNEEQPENAAHRAIEMVLNKIKGEPFVSELLPPHFDEVEPAPAVKDLSKIKLALVTDGGLIPEANPDHLKPNGSTTWGHYDWDELLADKHFVIHSGYDGTWVLENPNRLFPVDVLREYEAAGEIGVLEPEVYVACGNCASVSGSKAKGEQIAQALLEKEIDAVILTST